MRSALIKDIFREIGRTKSRFFSIFAIIALGAGFFAGLKATCPDMLATQEKYFAEQNLMDVRLVSTYGFSENDIDAIKTVDGIREIYPTYSKDVFIQNEENASLIGKVMAYPDQGMNEVVLLEGRLPENPGECLVEKHAHLHITHEVGDTVTVYTTDKNDPVSDTLERESWEVVGIVMSPQYISYDRGSASIGDGSVDTYIMVFEENFKYDVYTDVYITLDSTVGLSTFSKEYSEAVKAADADFEIIADAREKDRLEEIKKDAAEQIAEGKQEIADAEQELADAEQELADALVELEDAEKEIADGWNEYNDGLAEYEKQLAEFDDKIADAEDEIADGWAEVEKGWADYESGKEEYEAGRKAYEEGLAQFEAGLAASGMSVGELYSLQGTLEEHIAKNQGVPGMESVVADLEASLAEVNEYISAYEELLSAEPALEKAESELASAESELNAAENELRDAESELEKAKAEAPEEFEKAKQELEDAHAELLDAEKEIEDGWKEYEDGLAEFEEAKTEARDKIDKAKFDIAEAEDNLANLKDPIWYVFTREDNPGYSTYEGDANRIENVGKVFPVFFFLVAMLVCLTTMTRMVEEHRTQIGTMKALGYGKTVIMAKYIIYSALASVSGAVFGIAVCIFIFPTVIYSAYGMMYVVPSLEFVPTPGIWLIIGAICVACTTLAAVMSCAAELRECPAELMRPKAPKAGKRVLLERIPFIWKRLNFNRKVTVRNLFRYKKRIFMTILGIAGCTALTLTGFGLYSSISVILEKQYSEIFSYDLIVALDNDAGDDKVEQVLEELDSNEISAVNLPVYMKAADINGIGDLSLVVTDDAEALSEMILFRDRKSKEIYTLTDDGVIITERFAELAEVSAGDEITFICDDVPFTVTVNAVSENYAMHFIYMTEELYTSICGDEMKANMVFTTMSDDSAEAQFDLANDLTGYKGLLALSFARTTRESFGDTVENLNYVVILIIACAAALAFVVLYNLTNINITERIREIATIKVLGFYDREVSAYVFRENIILTLMGDAVGLFIGIWLHKFVLNVAQTDAIMFGRDLPYWTFIFAFVVTVIFAIIVNWIMFFRLKKVSMVESLKSVE